MAAYIDQIVMFVAGLFATYIGLNWNKLGIADKMPPAQRQGLARTLTIVGPLIMAIAVVLAAFEAFGAAAR